MTATSSSLCSDCSGYTATCSTAGCRAITDSTSYDEMFSPRRRIMSFLRSVR
ncbi:Uncharacterised protein [Bordetella pertussis]|nr:Uncharacterised protein [Bordetella pertussis]